MSESPRTMERNWSASAFSLGLSLFFACSACTYFWTDQPAWMPAAVFALQAMVAAILRFGWTAPCLLAGVILGVWLDPLVKGGTVDSQIYETINNLLIGAAIGLTVGIMMDSAPPGRATAR